jgi:transposase
VGRQEVTAMRPYSMDRRERIAAAVDHHEGSIRWIARTSRVSTSFIVRLPRRGAPPGRSPPSRTGAVRRRPWGRTTKSGSPT